MAGHRWHWRPWHAIAAFAVAAAATGIGLAVTSSSPASAPAPTPAVTTTVTSAPAASTTSLPTVCHARGLLPDPACTPGATNPNVTQATISTTICVKGWTATVRPPASITGPEKLASERQYGLPAGSAAEYDHLISLELGGAPNDPRNLWPEAGTIPNTKDQIENRLHALVCAGALPLTTAQQAIATDWTAAYTRYIGPLPAGAH